MPPPRKDICDCNALERASKEPDHPIRWDERMNEYYIAHGKSGRMMVYYCPFCGGTTPESRRSSFFAHVTSQEENRIVALFGGVRKMSDVIARFGPPDEEREFAQGARHPGREGAPERGEVFRGLVYKKLSAVADVVFLVGDSESVRGTWNQKYIGEKNGGLPSAAPWNHFAQAILRCQILGLLLLFVTRATLGQALYQIEGSLNAEHKASLLALAKEKGLTNVSGMGSLHGDENYFMVWSDAPPIKDIALRRYVGAAEVTEPDNHKSLHVLEQGVRTNLCVIVEGTEKRIELSPDIPVEVARRAVKSFLNGEVSEGLKKVRVTNLAGCERSTHTNNAVTLVFGSTVLKK
jgi:hypothetical protein